MAQVIVALDHETAPEALSLVETLGGRCDFYKVGLALFTRSGPGLVTELRERGKRVFLDLKFHDIPSTVAKAVGSAVAVGAELATVHTMGGPAMLDAAAEAAGGSIRLLGVTLLTSLSASEVEGIWKRDLFSMREEVLRLAELAAAGGLDGVVASPLEVEPVKRRHGKDFLVVTPGIRLPGDDRGDQTRVATPGEAAGHGADYLVVGRSVTLADDPAEAMERVLAGARGRVAGEAG